MLDLALAVHFWVADVIRLQEEVALLRVFCGVLLHLDHSLVFLVTVHPRRIQALVYFCEYESFLQRLLLFFGQLLLRFVHAGDPKVNVIVNVPSYCATVQPSEVGLKLDSVAKVERCPVLHAKPDALTMGDVARAETAVVRRVLVLHEDIAGTLFVVNEDPLR